MKNTMKALVIINAKNIDLRLEVSKKYLLECEPYSVEALQKMLQSLTKYEVKVRTSKVNRFINKHPEVVIYSLPELSRIFNDLTLEVEVPKISFEKEFSTTMVGSLYLPDIKIECVEHSVTWGGQDITFFHLESCNKLLDVKDDAFLDSLHPSLRLLVKKCSNAPFPHSYYMKGYYGFDEVEDSNGFVLVYKRETTYKEIIKKEKITL